MCQEGAHLVCKVQNRPQDLHGLGTDRRDVYGISHLALGEVICDLPGHGHCNILLRLTGGCAQMGGAYEIVKLEKGIFQGGGLLFKHVQGCTCQTARSQGIEEIGLVYNAAPGTVQHHGRGLHLVEHLLVQHAPGFVCKWRVDGNIVGPGKKLVQVHKLDAELVCHFRVHVRVICQDPHL